MLLGKGIDVMVIMGTSCCSLSTDSVGVLLGSGSLRSACSIAFALVLHGTDIAAATVILCVAVLMRRLPTTFLIVNKLFVLIKKTFLELIIGLRVLSLLLTGAASVIRDHLLELLVGRAVMSNMRPLDSVLARSDQLVRISTTELGSMLA